MKKAAILTWCDNNGPTNYGQILQCYAMQKLVEKWGYEPKVIQYRRKDERDFDLAVYSNETEEGRRKNELYETEYNIRVIEGANTSRVQSFKKFIRDNITLSTPCYTKEMVEYETRKCELLVCGSDQIWNPIWFDPIWFLDFGTKNQKRVAYAPSGIFYDNETLCEIYKKMAQLIENIDEVTIRENIGREILSKYTKKEIKVVLDPTLLLKTSDWDNVAAKRLIEEDYVFCYVMGTIRPYQLVIREIMRKYDVKKVVYIPSNLMDEGTLPGYTGFEDAGPAEFISLIKNAKAVCTDSFHGTVMSLLYKRSFFNIKRIQKGTEMFGGSERIHNLMEMLGIQFRDVGCVKDVRAIYDYGNSRFL